MTDPAIEVWEAHKGRVVDEVGDYKVIDCESCGFRHVVPLPSPAELEVAYQEQYYTDEKPLYLERARADVEWWNRAYDDRYDTFESLLGSGRRHVLDIGSGPGFFLLRGSERGWTVRGVEPSNQAAAHARGLGLDVTQEFFTDEVAATLGTFDVVHMSEVLEHIPDPVTMLERASFSLAPGGLLCVLVPNDYNPLQQIVRQESDHSPWWLAPPHHLNYFSPDSLKALVERAGFEVVLTEGTFPLEIFILMGLDYTVDDSLGRDCHSKRMNFELAMGRGGGNDVRRDLYRRMIGMGVGRQIMIVARKPGGDR